MLEKLNTCNSRVSSKTKTAETCVEEMIDYMHCVDHCVSTRPPALPHLPPPLSSLTTSPLSSQVAKKLFNYLK
jgi:hypothetical protein